MVSNYEILMSERLELMKSGIFWIILTLVFILVCYLINRREHITNSFLIGTFILCGLGAIFSGVPSVMIACELIWNNTDEILTNVNSDIDSIVAENATLEEKVDDIDKYLTNASIAEEITSYSKTDTLYEVKIKGTIYKFALNADEITADNTEGVANEF